MSNGNRTELNIVLRDFKLPNGAVNYLQVLKVPTVDRIPWLVATEGYRKIHVTLIAGIQVALEALNLSKPMSADQVIDLADAIIDSANEDNLSIEDVVLFLQKLTRGEMGTLFTSMDMAKFMKCFEEYRQERYSTLVNERYNQHLQTKGQGVDGVKRPILQREENIDSATFFELMETVYQEKNENNG